MTHAPAETLRARQARRGRRPRIARRLLDTEDVPRVAAARAVRSSAPRAAPVEGGGGLESGVGRRRNAAVSGQIFGVQRHKGATIYKSMTIAVRAAATRGAPDAPLAPLRRLFRSSPGSQRIRPA